MSDRDLRDLERQAREAPDDAHVWARYVRALEREGARAPADLDDKARRVRSCLDDAPHLAHIDVGDEVWVEERDTPYIAGRWRGVVRAVHFEPDPISRRLALRFRVWPLELEGSVPEIAWRVSPQPHWLVRGLELSPDDRLERVARGPSTRPPAAP